MDALELLAHQHDQVEALIELLGDDDFSDEQRQHVFLELADLVAAHAAIEERMFYPVVRAIQTEEFLLDEQHFAIKRALAELMQTRLDDPSFEARLAVLKEEIEHHAREEEEQVLFPKLRRLMSAEQLDALGRDMQSLFERLMSLEPRETSAAL